jgi:hypothetical protein
VGSWRLPAVELTYFDPAANRYRTASAEPGELVAGPLGSDPASGASLRKNGTLRPIRSAALPRPTIHGWRALGQNLLPWAFGIPWVLALVILFARRSDRRAPFPGSIFRLMPGTGPAASSPAGRALRRFRGDLVRALSEDRPRRAAAALERAWRHLLSDALGVPESTPVSSWPDALRETRKDEAVPGRSAERLAELLEDFHFLRYAPELSDVDSLAGELVARSERLGRELLR